MIKFESLDINSININDKFIIYGAGIGGEFLQKVFINRGLKICFFCDRFVEGNINGTQILAIQELENLRDLCDYKIILSVTRSTRSVLQYLDSINIASVYHVIPLLENIEENDMLDFDNKQNEVKDFIKKYKHYIMMDNKLTLQSLELFLTSNCTLKCKKCSHLIPYYRTNYNYEFEKLKNDIKKIINVVDEVLEVFLLGGEPLLYYDAVGLLNWLSKENKIQQVTILTNATITLSDPLLQCIKKTKTRIRISNYGIYSNKMFSLVQQLKENNINYFICDELWTDMGEIFRHNYSKEEQKELFLDCPFAYDYLLLEGKLYRCAHIAHLHNLELIEDNEVDYIDFNNHDASILDFKKKLQEFMDQDYMYGCLFCNGIKNSKGKIVPGEQITEEDARKISEFVINKGENNEIC